MHITYFYVGTFLLIAIASHDSRLGRFELFVAASTHCFPELTLAKSLQKLADLEYNAAEIVIGNDLCDLQPEWISQDIEAVCRLCVSCRQITPTVFFFNIPTDSPNYFIKFEQCLKLCKKIGIITLVVRSAPIGFPFNEEFERISNLIKLATNYGVIVSVLTEKDAVSGTVGSVMSLCKSIPGMRIALDPSQFIYGYKTPVNFETLLPKVSHIRLRDSNARHLQVKLGQGSLEYKRFVEQLIHSGYTRALCVDIHPSVNLNTESELRKMHLLLESLL